MDSRQRFEAAVRIAARREARRLQDENPEYRQYKVGGELRAYRKPPQNWSKHQERIVRGLLNDTCFRRMTNSQIVERVADWYAPYRPSQSIMTRPLPPKVRGEIQALLEEHGLAIQVKPEDTLSTLKRAIRAGHRDESEGLSVRGEVEIAEDYVLANGAAFKIEKHRTEPSIRVTSNGKRGYIRCDLLKALLQAAG